MVDRDAEALNAALADLPSDAAFAITADVSHPDQVHDMVAETLSRTGRINAVVNNAGVADVGPT